jgi:lysophospholipase L1-like esterase
MKKYLILLTIISALAVTYFGCEDFSKLEAPVVNTGSVDFARYVSIGNNLTAGYQSGSLYQSGQMYSFPYLIAKQVGGSFEIPAISDPGSLGRIEIVSLSPFTTRNNPTQGSPINLNYPAPYNNLGIPGALLYDVLNATNSTNCAAGLAGKPNPFFDIILRNSALNLGSQFTQAKVQRPTFLTLWIGNNDVLGYATSGGFSPSSPTDPNVFAVLFSKLMDSIATLGTKVVVANIPSVTAIPFFNTVGPQMSQSIPWRGIAALGAPGLFYQKHGEIVNPASFIDSVGLLTGKIRVTLPGGAYAPLLGTTTGKYYRDNKYPGLPAGIDTTKPFGFHPQNPFPDALVLDESEIQTTADVTSQYNATIESLTSAKGFGLVNMFDFFNTIRANDFTGGTVINGINFSTTYVTGGLFSLDGVHPTNQGHAIVANKFIEVINTKFGASLPLIDVSTIPGSLNFAGKISFSSHGYPVLPPDLFNNLYF